MATFTKPLDLYKHQVARFAKDSRDIRALHQDVAEAGHRDALELTGGTPSGRTRQQILRRTRPFARRPKLAGQKHGRAVAGGSLPTLPIGMISGRLRRAIRLQRLRLPGAVQAFGIAPEGVDYAKFILSDAGTRKMRGRGFQAEIKKRFRARNKALIDTMRARRR